LALTQRRTCLPGAVLAIFLVFAAATCDIWLIIMLILILEILIFNSKRVKEKEKGYFWEITVLNQKVNAGSILKSVFSGRV
jgi:hypothetical protein